MSLMMALATVLVPAADAASNQFTQHGPMMLRVNQPIRQITHNSALTAPDLTPLCDLTLDTKALP
jgi:hypothetical protein